MASTAAININIEAKTATDLYTLNSITLNDISLANNQISFKPRPVNHLNINDLSFHVNQEQTFQTNLLLNFPYLNNSINSLGTVKYEIIRTDNTSCQYIFTVGALTVDNFTYDFATRLCSINARTQIVTCNYSAWLLKLQIIQRFLQEIRL